MLRSMPGIVAASLATPRPPWACDSRGKHGHASVYFGTRSTSPYKLLCSNDFPVFLPALGPPGQTC